MARIWKAAGCFVLISHATDDIGASDAISDAPNAAVSRGGVMLGRKVHVDVCGAERGVAHVHAYLPHRHPAGRAQRSERVPQVVKPEWFGAVALVPQPVCPLRSVRPEREDVWP